MSREQGREEAGDILVEHLEYDFEPCFHERSRD
jgi:hypothetical protein